MTLDYVIEEFIYQNSKWKLNVKLDYKCSPYSPAIMPSFGYAGDPAEGGELEEVSAEIIEAFRDGSTVAFTDRVLIAAMETELNDRMQNPGPLLEAIEQKIYEQTPEYDDGYDQDIHLN